MPVLHAPSSARRPRWLVLLLASCLGAAAPACRRRPAEVTFLVSSQIGGVTAPCGCTSRPLGGLDRVAFQVEQRAKGGQAAYLVVGDTFFADATPPPAMRGHTDATARIVANILARLAPVAVSPGPRDRAATSQALTGLPRPQQQALGLLDGGQTVARLPVQSSTVRLLGHPVALLRVSSEQPPPATALAPGGRPSLLAAPEPTPALAQLLAQAATQARVHGAEGVLVLWPFDAASARTTFTQLFEAEAAKHANGTATSPPAPLVDAVLVGSEEAPRPPEQLADGQAVLLDGGARGEYLGQLRLHPGTGGHWQFYDGGAGERQQLEARRQRLQAEAERLPPGPAREIRQQRAGTLAAQIAQIAAVPPKSAYFTWDLLDMEEALPKAGWATDMLDAYNQALCDTALVDTAQRTCAAASDARNTYVGSATCQACHAAAFAVYEKTAHARAWATLTTAHKACDLSCVGCHVVGWEEPGGFCHLGDAAQWANVGCESCHGPGQGHVAAPTTPAAWGSRFAANPGEATCRGCHNAEHSDQFDFASYRPRILGPGHGQPASP